MPTRLRFTDFKVRKRVNLRLSRITGLFGTNVLGKTSLVRVDARKRVAVAHATGSDWLQHRAALRPIGVGVRSICDCNAAEWFQP